MFERKIVQKGAGKVVREGDGWRRLEDKFIGGGAAGGELLMIMLRVTLWEEKKQERFGVFWPGL